MAFFSLPEFEHWRETTENAHSWKVKYYKGLGTSTAKEAKEYFSDMERHRIPFKYSGPDDDDAILLVRYDMSSLSLLPVIFFFCLSLSISFYLSLSLSLSLSFSLPPCLLSSLPFSFLLSPSISPSHHLSLPLYHPTRPSVRSV